MSSCPPVLLAPSAGGERRGHHGAGSQLPGPDDHHPSDLPAVEGHQRPLHEEQPPHLLAALRSTGGLPAVPGGKGGGGSGGSLRCDSDKVMM